MRFCSHTDGKAEYHGATSCFPGGLEHTHTHTHTYPGVGQDGDGRAQKSAGHVTQGQQGLGNLCMDEGE